MDAQWILGCDNACSSRRCGTDAGWHEVGTLFRSVAESWGLRMWIVVFMGSSHA